MAQKELTTRQRRFAEAYLEIGDPEQAALLAGVSPGRAKAVGRSLLADPAVQRELRLAWRSRPRLRTVTEQDILGELCAIAFSDFTQYVRVEDGTVTVTDSRALDYSQRAAIAGIKDTGKGVEVKLHDKQKALELLTRYLGLFERPEQAQPVLRVELADIPAEWAA